MVADPSYYIYLKEKGLLLDYKSPEIKHHIMEVDKDGAWTSVRVCNMIIAYNKDKIAKEDIPTSWEDLTNPKYKGRIAMPNPLLSGTAYVAVGALADKFGWEYFDRLKANGLRVEEGNSAIQNKLLTGEYMAAIILEENVLKLQQTKKEPLEVVYPRRVHPHFFTDRHLQSDKESRRCQGSYGLVAQQRRSGSRNCWLDVFGPG